MYTQLHYSLAQQHIDDVRAGADRRRITANVTGDRPAIARLLGRIVRLPRRPWATGSGVTLSPTP